MSYEQFSLAVGKLRFAAAELKSAILSKVKSTQVNSSKSKSSTLPAVAILAGYSKGGTAHGIKMITLWHAQSQRIVST